MPAKFMQKVFTLLVFVFFSAGLKSQTITISGRVQDTAAKAPLKNALTMAIRLNDSTLVDYGRTNDSGFFHLNKVPLDTYIVVISHPQFADQTFIVVGSPQQKEFDFGKVVLPPKSNTLNEVVVLAYRDKVYYKGDTLMFTADSFKVKQNATVEDLLKKLPGVQVDAKGKIKVQGKEVSQVLVDGDEFFGSDPTVATKNLNANTVEAVQVYDKKNEDTESKDETVKVMNLKLKEEAKKGYFGKVSGAGGAGSDVNKAGSAGSGKTFYEGELLTNRFNKNRKYSIFALGANSPKQRFGWDDTWQYGLDNEMNRGTNDNGDDFFYFNNDEQGGIPQTIKSGFYFNDKITKKTKVNTDYTYNNNALSTLSSMNTQYFLNDTSYTDAQTNTGKANNESHGFNFKVLQNLDSLTELTIYPKVKYSLNQTDNLQTNNFYSEDHTLTRQSTIHNRSSNRVMDVNGNMKLLRRFKKKERTLMVMYNYANRNENTLGYLSSENDVVLPFSYTTSINQQKTSLSEKQDHQASLVFTEPLTKKVKLEFSYDYTNVQSYNDKRTKDYSGVAYDIENPLLTNNFKNTRQVNRGGLKFIYEVKKYRFSVGSRYRQIMMSSLNLTTNSNLSQRFENALPYASFRYKFGQNSSMDLSYTTSSRQPDLYQLQPIIDNTNPNRISLGNPALKPTFENQFNLNFYSFKPISGQNLWGGANFSSVSNAITNLTTYDNMGVATTQPVNVNGNYNSYWYAGFQRPILGPLKINPSINGSYSNNVNYINGQKNITTQFNNDFSLGFAYETDKLEVSVSGDYSYNQPHSTINNQSNKPYSSYELHGSFEWKMPKKFIIASDGFYRNNSQRAAGYNVNYVIWNASLSKQFLKKDNLIIGVEAYDILNQNINARRTVTDNRIIDSKSQVIRQYFLLRVTYKFNSNKAKQEEDDF